ncbi:MAG: hypothetical protein QOD04_2281, partial [Pseudonocardiales bacterium]|nr:hypothetical protein [Pseudonocardiales bacterium]
LVAANLHRVQLGNTSRGRAVRAALCGPSCAGRGADVGNPARGQPLLMSIPPAFVLAWILCVELSAWLTSTSGWPVLLSAWTA